MKDPEGGASDEGYVNQKTLPCQGSQKTALQGLPGRVLAEV
jgi:hypothetical protein